MVNDIRARTSCLYTGRHEERVRFRCTRGICDSRTFLRTMALFDVTAAGRLPLNRHSVSTFQYFESDQQEPSSTLCVGIRDASVRVCRYTSTSAAHTQHRVCPALPQRTH